MKKQDLATRLARKARTSKAVAADRLDLMVHRIIAELKKGNPVALPGLGTFKPGKKLNFQFEKPKLQEGARREKKH
jgi:nucleoid DNA-binding protein